MVRSRYISRLYLKLTQITSWNNEICDKLKGVSLSHSCQSETKKKQTHGINISYNQGSCVEGGAVAAFIDHGHSHLALAALMT